MLKTSQVDVGLRRAAEARIHQEESKQYPANPAEASCLSESKKAINVDCAKSLPGSDLAFGRPGFFSWTGGRFQIDDIGYAFFSKQLRVSSGVFDEAFSGEHKMLLISFEIYIMLRPLCKRSHWGGGDTVAQKQLIEAGCAFTKISQFKSECHNPFDVYKGYFVPEFAIKTMMIMTHIWLWSKRCTLIRSHLQTLITTYPHPFWGAHFGESAWCQEGSLRVAERSWPPRTMVGASRCGLLL